MTLTPVPADLPEVFTPPQRQDTDSWVEVVADVVRLSQQIAGTDFVPKGIRNNVPATAAAMLYGREVGLPPMTALTSIHVVDGRPGMSAEAMRALVLAAGHEIVFDETTGAICRVRGRRRGSAEWVSVSWTLDMGRAAGLQHRDNWRKYPRAMLIARATTDLCRMVFPDVIHGFRSTEELGDMGDADEAPVAPPVRRTRTVARKTRKVEDTELPPGPPLPGEPDPGERHAPAEGPTGGGADSSADSAPPPATVDPGRSVGADPTPSPEAAPAEPGPRVANRASIRMIVIRFRQLGLTEADADRGERLALTSAIVGRDVSSTAQLTADEADRVLATVASVGSADELRALIAANEADDPSRWASDDPLPDPEADTDVPLDDEDGS